MAVKVARGNERVERDHNRSIEATGLGRAEHGALPDLGRLGRRAVYRRAAARLARDATIPLPAAALAAVLITRLGHVLWPCAKGLAAQVPTMTTTQEQFQLLL